MKIAKNVSLELSVFIGKNNLIVPPTEIQMNSKKLIDLVDEYNKNCMKHIRFEEYKFNGIKIKENNCLNYDEIKFII